MSTTAVVVIGAILLVLLAGSNMKIHSSDLPAFSAQDLTQEKLVGAFVAAFIERDSQARELINPSNTTLFAEGYRPKIDLSRDPAIHPGRTWLSFG